MSHLKTTQVAEPSTPAASTQLTYADSGNSGRLTSKDSNGIVSVLANVKAVNLLRNAGFWFAQRQTPGSAQTYSNIGGRILTADGWWGNNENASFTYARVDTSGSPESGIAGRYYGQYIKITNAGKLAIGQVIEGAEIESYRGRNVRFRMKLKATVTATTYNIAVVALGSGGTVDTVPSTANTFFTAYGADGVDNTLGSNLTYLAPTSGKTGDNCTAGTNCYACSVTTSWQRFSGVFTVPTTCKNLVVLVYSHNDVPISSGINITEAMLVDGEDIPDWSHQSLPEEQYRVQRFYQKSFALETAPATNVGVNTGEQRAIAGKAGAVANSGFIPWYYQPKLHRSVTPTVYNPGAANALARNITGTADMGTTTITGSNECGSYVNCTGVAATAVGDLIGIHWSADAEL